MLLLTSEVANWTVNNDWHTEEEVLTQISVISKHWLKVVA